ncbi:MAG TPA: adenylate kinase [Acidimicrobiia bacterium]|nr:adenylate kinase [Acidimicrobiia bacterium]
MARRILFIGPPGAGKGTQAAMLARALKVPHVSTGAMLRDAVAAGTDLGKQVASVMAAGDLVSDDLVVAIVDDRLSADDARCGYLLDGFPRNVAQARALNDAVVNAIGTVILLEADTDELVARLVKRAQEEGRSDDNEETIRRRLEVYEHETAPLVDHYGDAVIRIDGVGSIDEVFSRIALALAS